jgi:hypothetical protein
MIKVAWAIVLVCALLVAGPSSDYAAAGGHSHSQFFFSGSIALGPWWPGYPYYPYYSSYPYYAYYPYYPYYPYYYPAPTVAVERQPQENANSGRQQQSAYWYYCQDPQGYYPYVKSCPGGWMKVVPQTTPPQQ